MPGELKQRTHVYVMRPQAYEIAGCECGNADPEWSEYQGRLWCPTCEIDFVPLHNGIFDGPIPIDGMALLGIDMRRLNIKTGQIEELPKPANGRIISHD